MAKKNIHVCLAAWVFDEIVVDMKPKEENRSRWVEQLLIKGSEVYKAQND